MRYRPVAAAAFAQQWFPGGATAEALGRAPVVVFDRDDELQHDYLRARAGAVDPPVHYVPASADFAAAVALGWGWGMLPDQQIRPGLVGLDPSGAVDVVLYWQQWKLRSAALDRVRAAVLSAAHGALPRR
jgi:LysR family transcriptional regulator (chromosome initiation inhibitor)